MSKSVEPIRLVIWDLDETLWRGTVTEGGITEYVSFHYEVVKQLARRGIVSSICSKNDRDIVRDILIEQGMWAFFVFPSIDWSGKAHRIAQILDAMHLRADTALFIDDNPSNRAEALALIPGLRVADETVIGELLDDPLLQGKADTELSRLARYKVLEQKSIAARAEGGARHDFLRTSAITVEVDHDVTAHLDRVVELINRTNQLNFTKQRLPEDAAAARTKLLQQLHAKPGRRSGLVRVCDRFGDYGIVGFWMMDGIWVEPYLIHFVFSCRTLGMGIEQWVYNKLGRPRLDPVGDVVSTLDTHPDWINQEIPPDAVGRDAFTSAPAHVRLRGGCELEVLKHFFSFHSQSVTSEFVFTRRGQIVWSSHTSTLFHQPILQTTEGRAALAEIGFTPEDFETAFFDAFDNATCLVLSNSADSQVPLYRHRRLRFMIPFKLFGIDLSGPLDAAAIDRFCAANALEGYDAAVFRRAIRSIKEDFDPISFTDVDFRTLYDRMAEAVPEHSLLVVLLPITHAKRPDGGIVFFPEQREINGWLRDLAGRHTNLRIVDMAECLQSDDELRNFSHLHFARDVYHRLYKKIVEADAAWRAEVGPASKTSPARFTPRAASDKWPHASFGPVKYDPA